MKTVKFSKTALKNLDEFAQHRMSTRLDLRCLKNALFYAEGYGILHSNTQEGEAFATLVYAFNKAQERVKELEAQLANANWQGKAH